MAVNFEPEMIAIPAGSSRMGANTGTSHERPVHRITLPAFELSKHEITRGQYRQFAKETGYRTDAERNSGGNQGCYAYQGGIRFGWTRGMSWRFAGFAQKDDHPAICISFNDAMAYVNWLSMRAGKQYRLPTEAEWEYAARGGSVDKFSFGNDEEEFCLHANGSDSNLKEIMPRWDQPVNVCADGHAFSAPVGSYQANDFGLHDMHGNAWEWTNDCWNDNYEEAPRDGTAWNSGNCSLRVVRGGGWSSEPWNLRPSNRKSSASTIRHFSLGFRIAKDL
ncbi:MAG: formylglycine-generating enzyme family protein [Sedimenticola sp.]